MANRSPVHSNRRVVVALAVGASMMSGCSNGVEGAFSGAALGAGGGAIIGSLYGEAGAGAAIGAVSGALFGAVIGDQNQRNERNAWRAYEARSYYADPPVRYGWYETGHYDRAPSRRYDRCVRRY